MGSEDSCLGQGPRTHLHYKGDLFLTSRFDPLEKAGVLVKIHNFFRFRTRSDEFSTQEENLKLKIHTDHTSDGPESQIFPIITSSIEKDPSD